LNVDHRPRSYLIAPRASRYNRRVSLRGAAIFLGAMAGAWLPHRYWARLPASFPMETAAFVAGLATLFLGAAIGIPGFLAHAHATTSLGLDAELHNVFTNPAAGYRQGLVQGFAGLSIFTFLLLTPTGWVTLYLIVSGTGRAMAAWFDDPIGDPLLTGLDMIVSGRTQERRNRRAQAEREALEGPAVADRLVSSAAAGIPGCDFVIVSSRRKPAWERGVAVFTPDACYRVGDPVEQTIQGRLRYLYPLTEHADLEVIRRSVQYDLPTRPDSAAVKDFHTSSGDQETRR
jgi:hypothetical protein